MNPLVEVGVRHALHPTAHVVGVGRANAPIVHGVGRKTPERVVGVRDERHWCSAIVRERYGKKAFHIVTTLLHTECYLKSNHHFLENKYIHKFPSH